MKKNDIVRNEQLATEMEVLKFKKISHTSDIKAATVKTCIRDKFEGFIFEQNRQHSPHVTFHTCMPPCPSSRGVPCLKRWNEHGRCSQLDLHTCFVTT